jgi:hypothetical protein
MTDQSSLEAARKKFIEEAVSLAELDIDIAYCEKHEIILGNHSPSTLGANIFDIDRAKLFFEKANQSKESK